MKKKIIPAFLLIFCIVMPSFAQSSPVWVPYYMPTFDGSDPSLPTTIVDNSALNVQRSFSQQQYRWTLETHGTPYFWMSLPILPQDPAVYQNQIRFDLLLPEVTPQICAGLLLNGTEYENSAAFFTVLICSDQTYAVMRIQNGQWTEVIPFTAAEQFNINGANGLEITVNDGWAEFLLNGVWLDTFYAGYEGGFYGLFAQPLSEEATSIAFSNFVLSFAPLTAQIFDMDLNTPTDLARMIKRLSVKERLNTTNGKFQTIEDIEMNLAQIGSFQTHMTDFVARDFIFQSDIEWHSAYERPNVFESGCGFVFRAEDALSFVRIFIAMDGLIYLDGFRSGKQVPLISYRYGSTTLDGSGTLTLAASGGQISVLYNQNLLGTVHDATWAREGFLGVQVYSGTNSGFGTNCKFQKNQIYIFE